MDMAKTCPTCHKENSQEATVCAFCGSSMMALVPSLTTEPVPDVPLKIKPPDHIIELTKLYSDIIALMVLGQEQPILIRSGEKTILGRYSPGETTPSVDLTPYNANLLGVSRKHATISHTKEGYFLEDLDSTNGTWLNESKLPAATPTPLQSGDLIRLGQLGLYVYFDAGRDDKNPEIELTLRKDNLDSRTFTFQDLATQLIPFLAAIEGVQKIYNVIAGRNETEISIISMQYDSEIAALKLKMNGCKDAYDILTTKFVMWKTKYRDQIKLLRELQPAAVPPANVQPAPENTAQQEIKQAEQVLAQDIIKQIASGQPEARQQELTQQLVPHLHALAFNVLNLTMMG